MIDWLTVSIYYPHTQAINDGFVVSVDSDGVQDWSVEKSMKVVGSHESALQVRSEDYQGSGVYSKIRLSGNYVKFLQGHNIWGTADIVGLTLSAFIKVFDLIGFSYEKAFIAKSVLKGSISRIDITENYDLFSEDRAEAFLYSLERSATLRNRGAGALDKRGTTLYFGKHSRRWALKVYLKYRELLAHKPKLLDCVSDLPQVTNYAKGLVRFELVFRGKELDKLGLSSISCWGDGVVESLYNRYLSKLQCSDNMKTSDHLPNLDGLPARLIAVVNLWYEGHDLKSMYPTRTFYRYKSEIKKLLSIDISIAPPNGKKDKLENSNVIPLVRVLEAKPKSVPDWAHGTSLYFEPDSYDRYLG